MFERSNLKEENVFLKSSEPSPGPSRGPSPGPSPGPSQGPQNPNDSQQIDTALDFDEGLNSRHKEEASGNGPPSGNKEEKMHLCILVYMNFSMMK